MWAFESCEHLCTLDSHKMLKFNLSGVALHGPLVSPARLWPKAGFPNFSREGSSLPPQSSHSTKVVRTLQNGQVMGSTCTVQSKFVCKDLTLYTDLLQEVDDPYWFSGQRVKLTCIKIHVFI